MTLQFTKHRDPRTGDYYDAVTVDETNVLDVIRWLTSTGRAHSLHAQPIPNSESVAVRGYWTGRERGYHIRVATPIQLTSDGEFVTAEPVEFSDDGVEVTFTMETQVMCTLEINRQAWEELFGKLHSASEMSSDLVFQYMERHNLTPEEGEVIHENIIAFNRFIDATVTHPEDNSRKA